MNIDKKLIQQLRQQLQPFIATVFSGWTGSLLLVLQAWLLAAIISDVFLHKQGLQANSARLTWLLAILLVRALLSFLQNLSAKQLSLKIRSHLRSLLYDKILELGPAEVSNTHSGELTTLAVQGIDSMDAYFSQYLPQLMFAALIPFSMIAIAFPVDFPSGLIFLLTVPLIPIFMIFIGKTAQRVTDRQWKALGRLGDHFLDTIQGLTTLKMYNSQNESLRIENASERYRRVTLSVLRISFLSALVMELVTTISTALVAVQLGLRLLHGQVAFQHALFLLILAPELYLPLRTLGLRFHAGATALSVSKQLFALLEKEKPAVDVRQAGDIVSMDASKADIHLQNATYAYQDRSVPAVQDISITIPAGKITALVGSSGSGKSTLFNLLLRFIDLQSGEILIGGQSLYRFDPESWRRQIAWVPQTPFLFNSTIAENIHLGHGEDLARVKWAAAQASLHETILTFSNGYQTRVGEQGLRLSGGQIQRLALARAFYRDTPILLLDEPTAYIDPHNAALIRDAIQRLSKDRTTLVIAHHQNTILRSDHAILLHQGRLAGSGSPQYVLETYRSLQLQTQPGGAPV